jgi:hypothetical protein
MSTIIPTFAVILPRTVARMRDDTGIHAGVTPHVGARIAIGMCTDIGMCRDVDMCRDIDMRIPALRRCTPPRSERGLRAAAVFTTAR